MSSWTNTAAKKRQRRRYVRHTLNSYVLLAPSLVFIILFTVYPIFRSFYLGMTDFGYVNTTPVFIGLENYRGLFDSSIFWKVMRNTLRFSLMTMIPSMIIGFFMALVLNGRFRGLRFARAAFFYPVMMPMIAVACIWKYIFMPENGMLATTLMTLFDYKLGDLLSSRSTVLPALAVMYNWKEAGYLMIFFLSGLQNLSSEYFEAAKIDGAGFWNTLTRITLPLMAPTTLFVTIIELTNSIKLVDHIVILTQGKPANGSSTLLYYIYQTAYNFFQQGKASALTTIMLVILMLIAMPQYLRFDKRIHYEG